MGKIRIQNSPDSERFTQANASPLENGAVEATLEKVL
jgi:hypothetical protein